MTGLELIADERKRQIEVEGWTPEHDDTHTDGALAQAGACYAMAAHYQASGWSPDRLLSLTPFPWEREWWKPSVDPVRNLAKAGALIAAEIDRLQRLKS